ncbi:MAG: ArnT family glycosyltransferase [Bacteroidia bacterium]
MNKLLKNYPSLLFAALLCTVALYYNYQHIVFKRPQSIHKWRQADGASLALNYYKGGMHFFQPQVHNLTSDSGRSGAACTSEMPILYYSAACLYKIFGYHEWLYRGLNTLIFFIGLLFLFRTLLYVLKDFFWAAAIPLLLFSSPVIVYYANNYLVNSSALAFTLIGWYYFTRFLFENEKKWMYRTLAFFFLAGAFKVTALLSLIAITGIYLLELLNLKKQEGKTKFSKTFIISSVGVFIIIAAWLKYADHYNVKHDCTYFSTTIFPIWNLDREGIHDVLHNIRHLWLDQYFHWSVLIFTGAGFIFLLLNFKKVNPFFSLAILLICLQAVVYILLQFWTFSDHDYYTIDLYIIPVLIFIALFDLLSKYYTAAFNSIVTKIIFTGFLAFNIYYANGKVEERYNSWMNDYPANKDFYTVTPYLREIGITENDTVISIPDFSNASLYLTDQKGWTEYTDAKFNRGNGILYNSDSAGVQLSINKGAKYLILNGVEELQKKPYLKSFANCLVGHYNKILVFKLKGGVKNFDADARDIKQRLYCDAENLSADKKFFTQDSARFEYGQAQSADFSRSGKFSCRLDKKTPYGMTIKMKAENEGESFVISAWRKIIPQSKSTIVASADGGFYNNAYTVTKTDSAGWEKITKEFTVTPELKNKEITLYLYNEEEAPAYFDDLEIIIYKKPDSKLNP